MCRIYLLRTCDLEARNTWEEQHAWLTENLEKLHRAFAPRVNQLKPGGAGRMKTKTHRKRARPPCCPRRPVAVSRVRAAAIARARVARAMIACEVSAELPVWFQPGYNGRRLPKNCWYVHCNSRLAPMTTGGTSIIVCISKRSGRVLRIEGVQGE